MNYDNDVRTGTINEGRSHNHDPKEFSLGWSWSGVRSTIIGEVVAEHPGRVVMTTRFGTSRIVDMLVGELLPRIC